MNYLVIGFYDNNPNDRLAVHIEAKNPEQAEAKAIKDSSHSITVCGTIADPDGKLQMAS